MPEIKHKTIGKHVRRIVLEKTAEEKAAEQRRVERVQRWRNARNALKGKKIFRLSDIPTLLQRVEAIEEVLQEHGWLPEDEDV